MVIINNILQKEDKPTNSENYMEFSATHLEEDSTLLLDDTSTYVSESHQGKMPNGEFATQYAFLID